MKISLVVVCHHSSPVLSRCVESFRRQAIAAGVEAEVVAVEHSEDAAELARVEAIGVEHLLERPNRGYAAGLNSGASEAAGEVLLLANPDIVFFPGSLGALLQGIERGFDVVGPQFVWDNEGSVLLPPAEDPAPTAEFARVVRRRSPRVWSATLSRTLNTTWQLWTGAGTIPVAALRGALLAVSGETLSRFGPFDEGYFLYYEGRPSGYGELGGGAPAWGWLPTPGSSTGGDTPPAGAKAPSDARRLHGNGSWRETTVDYGDGSSARVVARAALRWH
jgi:N-acetylglucosaminyl-diphospho-decaprenol L-rhamnosyltransferase